MDQGVRLFRESVEMAKHWVRKAKRLTWLTWMEQSQEDPFIVR
jgi:hypothetical protein